MTTTAIIVMIIAMTVIWGGLAAAILNLRAHPEVLDGPADPDEGGELRASQPHLDRDL